MELLITLVPLAVASAVVPVQIVVTILLLRAPGGRSAAVAWVAGLTTLRLLQGLVFGLLLGGTPGADATAGPGPVAATLLVVLGILLWVMAARAYLRQPDPDAAPPRWVTMLDGISTRKAFLLGIGLLAIGVKFWVFTLGAITAIEAAGLTTGAAILWYLVFIALAQSVHIGAIGLAYLAPARAGSTLARLGSFLERRDREIMIAIGLVFGSWFLLKGLSGLGVL